MCFRSPEVTPTGAENAGPASQAMEFGKFEAGAAGENGGEWQV
jgi:hypothetical protein